MRFHHTAYFLLLAATLAIVSPALAQQVNLDSIREGAPAMGDDQVIDNWISQRVDVLAAQHAAQTAEQFRGTADRFVEEMRDEIRNSKNSTQFVRRFAERVAELYLGYMSPDADTPAEVKQALARALAEMASVHTRETMLQLLGLADPVVRYYLAEGLVRMQEDVAVDERAAIATIERLGELAAQERNGRVAREIYRAMSYTRESVVDEAISGMLTAMAARAELRAAAESDIDRAPLAPLQYIQERVGNLTEPQRQQAVRTLAPLLREYVQVMAADTGSTAYQRQAAKEVIYRIEQVFAAVVRPSEAPNITQHLNAQGEAGALDREIELNRWIGTPDTPGVLNAQPWNVPVGAPGPDTQRNTGAEEASAPAGNS